MNDHDTPNMSQDTKMEADMSQELRQPKDCPGSHDPTVIKNTSRQSDCDVLTPISDELRPYPEEHGAHLNQETPHKHVIIDTNKSLSIENECPVLSAITFKYISLDLLKRAATSNKKASLSTLMTSLGLKDSNNVTINKTKLCHFLETCESKGNKETAKVIPYLINKIEDTTIKLELIANDLPLGPSAHDRKKDLIRFCLDQCADQAGLTKFVFDSGLTNSSHIDSEQQTIPQNGHIHPQTCNTIDDPATASETPSRQSSEKCNQNSQFLSSKDKKKGDKRSKKTKTKKSKAQDPPSQPNSPLQSQACDDMPTSSQNEANAIKEDLNHNYENDRFYESRDCQGCTELKQSMSILQESLLVLKEEVLQQKAISDLVIYLLQTHPKKQQRLLLIKD